MKKIKILLVDDEIDFLQLMASNIRDWGYDVVEADNGDSAINLFRINQPDIIILDYMMPKKDGIAALKEIKAIDNKVPVIMFTAYPKEEILKKAINLGINAFVPKLSAYNDIRLSLQSAINVVIPLVKK